MSNHYRQRGEKRGDFSIRNRKRRPKTFASEESANEWAKQNKISKYVLVNLKSTESKQKKIKVVVS